MASNRGGLSGGAGGSVTAPVPDLRASPVEATARLASFAAGLRWWDVPAPARARAELALLDVIGAAIAGSRTPVAAIVRQVTPRIFGGDEASMLLAGARASGPGAAFANGCLANALDIDDGYRPVKGHPGAIVFPAALAAAEMGGCDGAAFLAALVAGYEVAMRAGLAVHQAYADYHGSGSWGAVGAAAAAGKLLGLPPDGLAHALGIAEYHGPLSPIMRCVEHPAMVKDGIGWGAMAGVVAAVLAARGFTGLPTAVDVHPDVLDDVGREYKLLDLYFKPHPCCRWAQPPIAAVRRIAAEGRLDAEAIAAIRVRTFEAALHLGPVWPRTTEEAQYSLAWPVAAAVVLERVGPEQVLDPHLDDPRIRAVARRVEASVSPELDRRFPAEALCEVEIVLQDGSVRRSGVCGARGDPSDPLAEDELRRKFHDLAGPVIGAGRARQVERAVSELERAPGVGALVGLLS